MNTADFFAELYGTNAEKPPVDSTCAGRVPAEGNKFCRSSDVTWVSKCEYFACDKCTEYDLDPEQRTAFQSGSRCSLCKEVFYTFDQAINHWRRLGGSE